MNERCAIWGTSAKPFAVESRALGFDSPRAGGRYRIAFEATHDVKQMALASRAKLTTWLIDQRRYGDPAPLILPEITARQRSARSMSFLERRDRLLEFYAANNRRPGRDINIGEETQQGAQAWSESEDKYEADAFFGYLEEAGFIEYTTSGGHRLSFKGWDYLDTQRASRVAGVQAFVAMWFDPSMDSAFTDGVAPGIRDAGYIPMRIDQKEHNNKIDDEIIAEIRRSRFVVADFTSEPDKPRGGVYFEAGFTMGLNKPLIWVCREDLIGMVHFDTRQFNHITWTEPSELRAKLANRIGAVIGDGPLKGP